MRCFALLVILAMAVPVWSQEPLRLKDVAYGTHERQVLDFYQAKSDWPTPVIFHIHGGGWHSGVVGTGRTGLTLRVRVSVGRKMWICRMLSLA